MIFLRAVGLLFLFSCHVDKPDVTKGNALLVHQTSDRITLQVSGRVDTANVAVANVLRLYENYLNAQPDSLYDNPYWNEEEKRKFNDFDFSRASMFNGISSEQLFRIYKPFVLSVEQLNNKYQIRTLYANDHANGSYAGSKVWCIHKVSAIKSKGAWRLENLMVEETKNWQIKQVGFIDYMFPPNYQFKPERAAKAMTFCRSIINRFNPGYSSRFRFYITDSVDDMGKLENFDYYFTGITTGKAREGMILSSKNDEFYPHELVHKLLPVNEQRGPVIEEGLATFLGTKENDKVYQTWMSQLSADFQNKHSYTLENILNNETDWNGYPAAYPGGALICEVIHQGRGDAGLLRLMKGNTRGFDEIMKLCMEILQVSRNELNHLIQLKIQEFR